MSQLKKHKRKLDSLTKKIDSIQAKHPDFDFDDHDLRRSLREYEQTIVKLIHAQVNYDFCSSESFMKTCQNCDCGKLNVKR